MLNKKMFSISKIRIFIILFFPVLNVLPQGFNTTAINWSIPTGGQKNQYNTVCGYNYTYGITTSYDADASENWGIMDINGDGKTDLVVFSNDFNDAKTFYASGQYYWKVFLNTGNGFSKTATNWTVPSGGQKNEYGTVCGYNNSYGTATSYDDSDSENWGCMDMNGDGKIDLVVFSHDFNNGRVFSSSGQDYWKVYLNDGTKFSNTASQWNVPSGGQKELGSVYGFNYSSRMRDQWDDSDTENWGMNDMNGDGKIDLVVYSNGNMRVNSSSGQGYWKVYLSDGTKFSNTPIQWNIPSGGQRKDNTLYGYNYAYGTATSYDESDSENWGLYDMNSDGKIDIVAYSYGSGPSRIYSASGQDYWKVYLNDGTKFSTTATQWNVPSGGQKRSIFYGYNNAFGTATSYDDDDSENWGYMDIDGDKKTDLVVFSKDFNDAKTFYAAEQYYWKVFLNTGSQFSETATNWIVPAGGQKNEYGTVCGYNNSYGRATSYDDSDSENWICTDINGDGVLELVVCSYDYNSSYTYKNAEGDYWKVYVLNESLNLPGTPLNIGAGEGSTVTFDILSNTDWTISDSEEWLTANPLSGSDNGTITLTATANTSTSPRNATITVTYGAKTASITVTQAGAEAELNVSASTLNVGAEENLTKTFNITSNSNWEVSSNASWLNPSATDGSGNSTITLTADENFDKIARFATITIFGSGISKTINVTQAAWQEVLQISTTTLNVGAAANSTVSFNITSNTSWGIISSQTWLTIDDAYGWGNASPVLTADINQDETPRTATVTISSADITRTITVTQAGTGPKTLTVSDITLNIGAEDESINTFIITSNTDWTISCSEWWLSSDVSSGNGNYTITLTADLNSGSERQATLTIYAQGITREITVNQYGAGTNTLEVSETEVTIGSDQNSTATFDVFSNVTWNVNCNEDWLSADINFVTGKAIVTITADANNSESHRLATVTVSGSGITRIVTVDQTPGKLLEVSEGDLLFIGPDQVNKVIFLTSNTEWTVFSSGSWLTYDIASGTGNGIITLSADANTTGLKREATLLISGLGVTSVITVYQYPEGMNMLEVTETSLILNSFNNRTATFVVFSNINWDMSCSHNWLTLDVESLSDRSIVTLTATANTSENPRYATVTVTGEGISREIYIEQYPESGTSGIATFTTEEINVYPNPCINELFIDNANGTEESEILLYNSGGILIRSFKTSQVRTELKTNDLNSGIYFLKIKTLNGTSIRKIIKK